MTPQQMTLIRETWRKLAPIGDAAAEMFYSRLFEMEPALRMLFHKTDMAAQRRSLVQALSFVVDELENPEALRAALLSLGSRHAAYGAEFAHFDAVGAALLWTLEKGLGPFWSPEAEAAWTTAYRMVAETMLEGARQASALARPA